MGTTASTIRPPRTSTTPLGWLRRNLFNSWLNTLITLFLLWAIPTVLYQLARWIIGEATWDPVIANLRLLMTGRYPLDQVWRVQVCVAIVFALLGLSAGVWRGIVRAVAAGLAIIAAALALLPFGLDTRVWLLGIAALIGLGYAASFRAPKQLRLPTTVAWLVSPFVLLLLIRGGFGLLPLVETGLWGGLLLTIMLAVVGIVASFPLGVLLALGRRSSLPVVKWFCVLYIEIVRGVPLITVLFMSVLMLPLFLPANLRVDNLARVMVAITLFSAAYLAENIRGGLQAVPTGQVEAARALGLNVFQNTFLIVLPQALRAVIPAIVGQFISLFKDTSLVSIVGLAELLGIAGIVINQPEWLAVTGGVEREVLLFVALIYWMFCFALSQVSRRIELNLGVGTR
ncbi:MAG: amino acid ABC transporter permease [Roseiflexaceae bacterium]|nr:amino acid ABC transporter permease [Roseiflexaceae bacterium]